MGSLDMSPDEIMCIKYGLLILRRSLKGELYDAALIRDWRSSEGSVH